MRTVRRVVHVHLLSRCNLRCVHCYSEAAPERREALDRETLLTFCDLARGLGYGTVSLSGGEPTLYDGLEPLAMGMQHKGLAVNMISNGLRPSVLRKLRHAGWAGAVGISFDGLGVTHDEVRQRVGAFDRAIRTLGEHAAAGGRVGASICVSSRSYGELPDLVDLLVSMGASFVHFHPLTDVGRARSHRGLSLASADFSPLWLMVRLFEQLHPQVQLRVDLAPADQFVQSVGPFGETRPPATIIVDEVGGVYPFCYGIGARFRLGNIASIVAEQLVVPPELDEQLRRAFTAGSLPAFVDPYAMILDAARDSAWSAESLNA